MIDLEKLVDAAIDLRIANLKAREHGIIGLTGSGDDECFQIYGKKNFKEIIKGRDYSVKRRNDDEYRYEYTVKVSGLKFICIVENLMFEEDKSKIKEVA